MTDKKSRKTDGPKPTPAQEISLALQDLDMLERAVQGAVTEMRERLVRLLPPEDDRRALRYKYRKNWKGFLNGPCPY